MTHTLASHEQDMPDCSDPDCEFHHPEVLEDIILPPEPKPREGWHY